MAENYTKKEARIMVYTRETDAAQYPAGLSRSIHLACSRDGKYYEPLNNNYGILFAEAAVDEADVIHAKGVKNPRIFAMPEGGFGIIAVRVNEDGSADEDSRGSVLLWTTADFKEFKKIGFLSLHEDAYVERAQCNYDKNAGEYCILWQDEPGNCYQNEVKDICSLTGISPAHPGVYAEDLPGQAPEGAEKGNSVEISVQLCDETALYWNRLYSVKVQVPGRIHAHTPSEIEKVRASVLYSDGSCVQKQVKWELGGLDFQRQGTSRIRGTVQNEQYQFPLACGFGDPVIFPWEGRYYFIATNDNLDDVGFYVREAEDTAGLFREDTQQHLILGLDEERGFVQTFWAPEFHVIGGELYILFAISGKKWGPQCHLMKLKKGESLIDPESWEEPVRIRKKDGSFLAEDGITLDMTYLKAGERSYVVWSYRRNIGTPYDTGSMLYIAQVDEKQPWQLSSDPVLLTRPLYGWENVNHTINNEGPYAFTADGKVYLTYSGGAADGYTYALGLLTADAKDDLLDISVWKKRCTPVLSYYSMEGIYGPGHNSFFTDAQGNLMIAYHAEDALEHHLRCDGIHRVHFNIHGEPVFDLSAKRDLDPALSQVEMEVTVG
ncbi:family 43 glycosylhydrolase [Eisenbergiella sp.]